jgi:hypothetical protein
MSWGWLMSRACFSSSPQCCAGEQLLARVYLDLCTGSKAREAALTPCLAAYAVEFGVLSASSERRVVGQWLHSEPAYATRSTDGCRLS